MISYAAYEHLDVKVANRVAVLTLNRPEVRNAMNRPMIRELHRIWRDLADDLSVNVVVLTGAGLQFSVGGDVKQMSTRAGGDFYAELADKVMAGQLTVPVEAVYAMTDIGKALDHAKGGGRKGKILVMPNTDMLAQRHLHLLVSSPAS